MDNLKERFFAQYWGLECGANKFGSRGIPILPPFFTMVEYLELKPSKNLTEAECEYIKNKLGENVDFYVTAAFDYARSLGYLVPFMGMSEDDLIKKGWVKIIE